MTGAPGGEERGIIPRAIEQVAERKAQLENSGWTFEMQISFIEIYCEQIRDLLGVGDGSEESNKTNAQYCKILCHPSLLARSWANAFFFFFFFSHPSLLAT